MTREWSEEDIAAYIDGALDEEDAMRIEEIIARDPEAQALADEVWRSNDLLRAAFSDVTTTPIPTALADTVTPERSNIVPLARKSRLGRVWLPAAAAASVAIMIGVAVGTSVLAPPQPALVTLGDAPQDSALTVALETIPSGTMHGGRIVPMLTFQDAEGRFCREFEVTGELPEELQFGIACRTVAEAWHVEIIVTAPEADRGEAGFVPASGPGADALEAMLDALGAGLPLPPAEEQRVIERQWQGD
ncbi:MAG: hypothetical protein AAFR17_02245 [Pseudomonadota bacterium]